MKDKVSSELADWICEVLTFCLSPEHEENLRAKARKMNLTWEQSLAMALTESIREKFHVARRSDVN
jgi:hypothetical protein